jgi:hypothetical protein
MKNLTAKFQVPAVFVMLNDKTMFVTSMVLSTISVCILTNFAPQLMPLWMQLASTPVNK